MEDKLISDRDKRGYIASILWNFYKQLPIYNWDVQSQMTISFLIFALPPALILTSVIWNYVPASTAKNLLLLIVAGGTAGMFYFSDLFSKNIGELVVGPILPTTNAAADGDLTRKISLYKHKDAVGKLANSFNRMIKNLTELITKVQSETVTVSVTSQELAASSEELNATTEQISSAIVEITSDAEDQVRDVESVTKNIQDMSKKAHDISISAQTAAEVAETTNEIAKAGGKSAEEAIEKMKLTNSVMKESSDVVQKFSGKSKEIDTAAAFITEIADQTQMLALNAAIEAARAGDQGRGFAVVAQEVKKLAEGSAKAASDIEAINTEIQVDTNNAISAMDKSFEEVVESSEVVSDALGALEKIVIAVDELAKRVEQISDASMSQSKTSIEIVDSVENIGAKATDVAANIEEVSAATTEQCAHIQELTSTAMELANVAENLQDEIGRFKVKESPKIKPKAPKASAKKIYTKKARAIIKPTVR